MGDRKNNVASNGCSRKKRILAAVLAICLAVTVTLAPARAASVGATVSIAGGAIGTAGIASGVAIGSLALPVLGIVGLVLLGTGINVALTNASEEAGMTKTDYIQSKLSEFAEARGQNINDLINLMSNHLAVMSDGNVVVGQEAGQVIQQFGDWLYSEDMVSDSVIGNSDVILQTGNNSYNFAPAINGMTIRSKVSGDEVWTLDINVNNSYVAWAAWEGRSSAPLLILSESAFNYTIYRNGSLRTSGSARLNQSGKYYLYSILDGQTSLYSSSIPINENIPSSFYLDWAGNYQADTGEIGEDVFTGKEQDWTDNKDLLVPGEGEATILSGPDVINPAATALGTGDWTISVPDYLDALARAYNKGLDAATGAGDVSVSLTDTATGAKTSTAVNVAAATPVVQVDTYPRPGTGSGLPLTDPGLLPDPGDVFNLPVGWERKFPFSAFDNVNSILTMLGTNPVTPYHHFHWEYEFDGRPIVVDFEVDLSSLNELANYFRMLFRILWLFAIAKRTWAMADPALRGD